MAWLCRIEAISVTVLLQYIFKYILSQKLRTAEVTCDNSESFPVVVESLQCAVPDVQTFWIICSEDCCAVTVSSQQGTAILHCVMCLASREAAAELHGSALSYRKGWGCSFFLQEATDSFPGSWAHCPACIPDCCQKSESTLWRLLVPAVFEDGKLRSIQRHIL